MSALVKRLDFLFFEKVLSVEFVRLIVMGHSHCAEKVYPFISIHFFCTIICFIIVTYPCISAEESSISRLRLRVFVTEIYSLANATKVFDSLEFNETGVIPEYVVRFNETITVLLCEGEEPVEWVYNGEGSPNLVKEELMVTGLVRENGDINEDENNHGNLKASFQPPILYSSELKFRRDRNFVKRYPFHTGQYECRSGRNHSLKSSVYLFFPGTEGSSLLIRVGRRRNTIHQSRNSQTGILQFPCLLTNPAVNISLYKKNEQSGRKVYERLSTNVTYDPKFGFSLGYSSFNNSLGSYKCSTPGGRKDYAIFNVIEERDVKVYPNETMIFSSTILNLTCEAQEPVTIQLVAYVQIDSIYEDELPALEIIEVDTEAEEEGHEFDDDDIIESETEQTELEVHMANHVDLKPSIGDLGEFQCLSEIDGTLLHSWIYQIISPEADNERIGIRYNKSRNSFTCQTKTSAHGKLAFIFCDSPSECKINLMCFKKYSSCRGYNKLPGAQCDWENDCREIFHHSGTGYIRCAEDGVDEILSFADLPGGIHLGKDLDSVEPSHAAFITHEMDEVHIGDTLRVYLKKWSYLFLKEHKWAVRFKNESLSYSPRYNNLASAKFDVVEEMKAVEIELFLRNTTSYHLSLPIHVIPSKLVGASEG